MDNDEYSIDISTVSDYATTIDVGNVYHDISDNTLNVYTSAGEWDTIDISGITVSEPVEFEDCMPDIAKVEDMCNDYPGLRKAYENFKAVYKMVHQDWQGRQDDGEELHY